MAAYRGFDLRSGLAAHGGFCKFPAVLFDRPVCIDSEVRSLVCLCVCSFVCLQPRGHHDRSENAGLGERGLSILFVYFCGGDSGEAD